MSDSDTPSLDDVVAEARTKARHGPTIVSISRYCEMTRWDRDAVTKWVTEKGCPYVHLTTVPGEATMIDVRAVSDWREAQARNEAIRKSGSKDPITGEPVSFKDRAPAADARRKELQLAADAKIVAAIAVVAEGFSTANAVYRTGVKDLPEELARDAAGFPDDVVSAFRSKANDRVRAVLADTAAVMERTMRAAAGAAAPRLVDPDEEDADA